jgi:O-succinylbenzoate synthase
MLSWVKGNYIAKASLDLAWWDLHARSVERPLWNLIGGQEPEIKVGADIGILPTFEALFERIEEAQADGFERIKLKYGAGWDLPMLSAVRERFSEVVFHIDCNSAYRLSDLRMLQELDCYDLEMIEQPLAHDDLVDHAILQSNIKTALCLDESIISVDKARKAIEIGACRWINIKLGRVGGLTNALAIHDLCNEASVPCWVGGMLESAIGQSHNIAMATKSNIKYPSDIFPSSRFYKEDITHSDIVLSGPSKIKATDQPGIGCEPAPYHLSERMIQMAKVD